jgi:beta propeller repeat protein
MKKNGGGRMKINKNLYSVTFASVALILFLILFSSAASATSPMVTETRMTTNPSNSENPVIYGNTIAWQDDRNGNWDIYIYDLSTRQELHTTNTSNQVSPDVYGNRVVWEDERNGGHDIYLQDLSTKKQTRITTSGKAINPAIYGDKIVWADGRNNGSFNEGGGSIGRPFVFGCYYSTIIKITSTLTLFP